MIGSSDEPQTPAEAKAVETLRGAIDRLYTTFASYPLRSQVVGCTHCVFPGDEARLHSKPLRQLNVDDLDKYASAALSTWGDEDDFRHFLPRLFELMAFERLGMCCPEILAGKLEYAGWRTWPEGEQAAVEAYLSALWCYVLTCCPFTGQSRRRRAEEDLCTIAQAVDDLGPFLSVWRESKEMSARYHLAQLIDCDGWETLPDELVDSFWSERQAQMRQVIDWVLELAALEILREALARAPAEFVPQLGEAVEQLERLQTHCGAVQDNR